MSTLVLKRNDTGIGIKATLKNNEGNVDLTDADVSFFMGKNEITPVITEAKNGQVMIVFEQIHTAISGFYDCEFKVRFEDGRIETFPNDGFLKVRIMDDLGGSI